MTRRAELQALVEDIYRCRHCRRQTEDYDRLPDKSRPGRFIHAFCALAASVRRGAKKSPKTGGDRWKPRKKASL